MASLATWQRRCTRSNASLRVELAERPKLKAWKVVCLRWLATLSPKAGSPVASTAALHRSDTGAIGQRAVGPSSDLRSSPASASSAALSQPAASRARQIALTQVTRIVLPPRMSLLGADPQSGARLRMCVTPAIRPSGQPQPLLCLASLERDVVVEILFAASGRRCRRLIIIVPRGSAAPGTALRAAARRTRAARASAEHLHIVGNDLGSEPIFALLILPFSGAQLSLDEHLRTLAQIFRGNLSQSAEQGDAVPFGALLLRPGGFVLP